MAWTELHDTLPDHPKTMLLAAEMNCTKPHAIGILCSLWCYTMRYGNKGTLSPTYWKAFAVSMGMDDPDGALAALRSSGWVEPNGDNVTCHDWDDYAGRLEDYKAANRERQRRYRERARENLLDNANVTRDVTPKKRESHTTVPNSTQHNQTEQTTLPPASRSKPRKPHWSEPHGSRLAKLTDCPSSGPWPFLNKLAGDHTRQAVLTALAKMERAEIANWEHARGWLTQVAKSAHQTIPASDDYEDRLD